MLAPNLDVWVQRVAVDVERRQLESAIRDLGQVLLSRSLARHQRVDGDVRRRNETAGVHLDALQTHATKQLEHLAQGPVLNARCVSAKFHPGFLRAGRIVTR